MRRNGDVRKFVPKMAKPNMASWSHFVDSNLSTILLSYYYHFHSSSIEKFKIVFIIHFYVQTFVLHFATFQQCFFCKKKSKPNLTEQNFIKMKTKKLQIKKMFFQLCLIKSLLIKIVNESN